MIPRVEVLGIDVERTELCSGRDWLMPVSQPILIAQDVASARALPDQPGRLTTELRDSFEIYGQQSDAVVWLARREAAALPSSVRRQQPTTHQWPSPDVDTDLERLVRYLEKGRRRSRHDEVPSATWERASGVLPGAAASLVTSPGEVDRTVLAR